jgi:hypothetical protein
MTATAAAAATPSRPSAAAGGAASSGQTPLLAAIFEANEAYRDPGAIQPCLLTTFNAVGAYILCSACRMPRRHIADEDDMSKGRILYFTVGAGLGLLQVL